MNSAVLPCDTTTLQAMVVAQQAEIEHLKLIIAKLRRMQFGQSSEKIDEMVGQLELALEELETGKAERAGVTKLPRQKKPPANPSANPCRIICPVTLWLMRHHIPAARTVVAISSRSGRMSRKCSTTCPPVSGSFAMSGRS